MIKIEGSVMRTDLMLKLPIEPITSGCKNCVFLQLHFSRHWKEYTDRRVEFRSEWGKRYCAKVSKTGVCIFPEAILQHSGKIFLSVVGIRQGKCEADSGRVVTELVPMRVFRGGYSEESEGA